MPDVGDRGPGGDGTTVSRAARATGVVVLALLTLAAGLGVAFEPHAPALPGNTIAVVNATALLGGMYRPGAVQGVSGNASALLLGGNGPFAERSGPTVPLLTLVGPDAMPQNASAPAAGAFGEGAPFVVAWNGSSWLIGGERLAAGAPSGALVELRAGVWTDRTPGLGTAFAGGGVWALGWNGTDWLVGGSGSAGAVLLALGPGSDRNLSALLPNNTAADWVQWLAWNGTGWLVGGGGVFGTLEGARYHDLLPSSPFRSGGVFSADWNGSAWLAGGGAPAALAVVRGTEVVGQPELPPGFDRWVNIVFWTPEGWIVGGRGTTSGGASAPELALWATSGILVDDSALLPTSFAGGEILAGARAPSLGPDALVVAGEGALDPATGSGYGALAEIEY